MTDFTSRQIADGALGEIILIGSISFESRSLALAEAVGPASLARWICLKNRDIEMSVEQIERRANEIAAEAGIALEIEETTRRDPLSVADAIRRILEAIGETSRPIVVDVSTMTHETALMVVAGVSELAPRWSDLRYAYNAAGQYGGNDRDNSQRWLSRGIQCVRSVVGYSGLWSPGDRATLVALPGFDLERVRRIVDEIEPDRVIVGVARPSQPEHQWMYARNHEVARSITAARDGVVFEYGALDPIDAAMQVAKALEGVDHNVIIAPLNTKVSTIAVGMLALANSDWQVCYAPALVYNIHYSKHSECFQAFGHDELVASIAPFARASTRIDIAAVDRLFVAGED